MKAAIKETEIPEENNDEFNKAFAEFSGGEPPKDEEEVPEDLDEDLDGLLPEDDEPKDDDPPKDEDLTVDDYKAKLEEAENEKKLLEHKYKSDQGRVAAYQRKAHEAEAKLNEALQKKDAPTEEQIKDALEDKESWKEFKEDYPEFAEDYAARTKEIQDLKKSIDEKIAPLNERIEKKETADYESHQIAALELPQDQGGFGYPDWRETTQSDEFKGWIEGQHPSVQALCDSNTAADAAYVLDLYTAVAPKKPAADDDDQAMTEAEKTKARRKKNLARNVQTTGKQGGPSVTAPDDFEKAFDFFVEKKKKQKPEY